MPLSIVDETLTQAYSNRALQGMDILWLTGEPLVMGLPYFREVVRLCLEKCPHDKHPEFVIQTNGTLINDEWCEFFSEYNFEVGVSVDGPAYIHDKQRLYKSGRPTFSQVERGIDLLIKHKVRGGAICVITEATLDFPPEDLFHFFYAKKIAWSYLIEAGIGENKHAMPAQWTVSSIRLERFLDRLLDLWAEYPDSYIRDFEQTTRRVFGGSRPGQNNDNLGCLDILNVSADGDFYWGNPELMSASLGTLSNVRFNLNTHNVWQCRSTPAFIEYQAEIHAGILRCRNECQFYAGCQGGNPAHKYYEVGSFDISQHTSCRLNDQTIQTLMVRKLAALETI